MFILVHTCSYLFIILYIINVYGFNINDIEKSKIAYDNCIGTVVINIVLSSNSNAITDESIINIDAHALSCMKYNVLEMKGCDTIGQLANYLSLNYCDKRYINLVVSATNSIIYQPCDTDVTLKEAILRS